MVYVVVRPCLEAESIIFRPKFIFWYCFTIRCLQLGVALLLNVCNFLTFRYDRQVWK